MFSRGRQAARSLPVLIDHPIAPGSAGGFFLASRRPPAAHPPLGAVLLEVWRLQRAAIVRERGVDWLLTRAARISLATHASNVL